MPLLFGNNRIQTDRTIYLPFPFLFIHSSTMPLSMVQQSNEQQQQLHQHSRMARQLSPLKKRGSAFIGTCTAYLPFANNFASFSAAHSSSVSPRRCHSSPERGPPPEISLPIMHRALNGTHNGSGGSARRSRSLQEAWERSRQLQRQREQHQQQQQMMEANMRKSANGKMAGGGPEMDIPPEEPARRQKQQQRHFLPPFFISRLLSHPTHSDAMSSPSSAPKTSAIPVPLPAVPTAMGNSCLTAVRMPSNGGISTATSSRIANGFNNASASGPNAVPMEFVKENAHNSQSNNNISNNGQRHPKEMTATNGEGRNCNGDIPNGQITPLQQTVSSAASAMGGAMTNSILASAAWYRDRDGRTGYRPDDFAQMHGGRVQSSPIKSVVGTTTKQQQQHEQVESNVLMSHQTHTTQSERIVKQQQHSHSSNAASVPSSPPKPLRHFSTMPLPSTSLHQQQLANDHHHHHYRQSASNHRLHYASPGPAGTAHHATLDGESGDGAGTTIFSVHELPPQPPSIGRGPFPLRRTSHTAELSAADMEEIELELGRAQRMVEWKAKSANDREHREWHSPPLKKTNKDNGRSGSNCNELHFLNGHLAAGWEEQQQQQEKKTSDGNKQQQQPTHPQKMVKFAETVQINEIACRDELLSSQNSTHSRSSSSSSSSASSSGCSSSSEEEQENEVKTLLNNARRVQQQKQQEKSHHENNCSNGNQSSTSATTANTKSQRQQQRNMASNGPPPLAIVRPSTIGGGGDAMMMMGGDEHHHQQKKKSKMHDAPTNVQQQQQQKSSPLVQQNSKAISGPPAHHKTSYGTSDLERVIEQFFRHCQSLASLNKKEEKLAGSRSSNTNSPIDEKRKKHNEQQQHQQPSPVLRSVYDNLAADEQQLPSADKTTKMKANDGAANANQKMVAKQQSEWHPSDSNSINVNAVGRDDDDWLHTKAKVLLQQNTGPIEWTNGIGSVNGGNGHSRSISPTKRRVEMLVLSTTTTPSCESPLTRTTTAMASKCGSGTESNSSTSSTSTISATAFASQNGCVVKAAATNGNANGVGKRKSCSVEPLSRIPVPNGHHHHLNGNNNGTASRSMIGNGASVDPLLLLSSSNSMSASSSTGSSTTMTTTTTNHRHLPRQYPPTTAMTGSHRSSSSSRPLPAPTQPAKSFAASVHSSRARYCV